MKISNLIILLSLIFCSCTVNVEPDSPHDEHSPAEDALGHLLEGPFEDPIIAATNRSSINANFIRAGHSAARVNYTNRGWFELRLGETGEHDVIIMLEGANFSFTVYPNDTSTDALEPEANGVEDGNQWYQYELSTGAQAMISNVAGGLQMHKIVFIVIDEDHDHD